MSTRQIAIVSSLLLHLMLAFIAFFSKFTILPSEMFNRIEILEFGFDQPANNQQKISPVKRPPSSSSKEVGKKSNLIPEKVDLPKVEQESFEKVAVPYEGKSALNSFDLDDKIGNSAFKTASDLSEEMLTDNSSEIDEKPFVSNSENYLNSLNDMLSDGLEGDSPFILEGDITQREIIEKKLPAYPEGLQKNVLVKIKFEVMSDGSVGDMIIVRKADPVFEEKSLQALENWKFNPVNKEITQIGFITFVFRLK